MSRSTSGIGYGNPNDCRQVHLASSFKLHLLADRGLMLIPEHANSALCRKSNPSCINLNAFHCVAQYYGSLGRGEAGILRQRSISVSITTRTPFYMSLLQAKVDQEANLHYKNSH